MTEYIICTIGTTYKKRFARFHCLFIYGNIKYALKVSTPIGGWRTPSPQRTFALSDWPLDRDCFIGSAHSAPPFCFRCFLFQYWFLTEQWHDHIRQRQKRDCTAFKRFLREDTDELLLVLERLGRDVTVSWHWRCVFVAFVVICCGDLPKASTQEFWHSLYWLLHCFPFAAVSLEFLYYTKEQFAAINSEIKIPALAN